jgi:hypothetical protein
MVHATGVFAGKRHFAGKPSTRHFNHSYQRQYPHVVTKSREHTGFERNIRTYRVIHICWRMFAFISASVAIVYFEF